MSPTATKTNTNGKTAHPELADDGRDPKTERWLESLHVKFTFEPAIPLDQIDQQASLANQARLHALDDDVVDRYTADMTRGDTFPPLLAVRRPRRKPMLLGGNHRYTAAIKAKRPTIAVYVVDAEPEMATRLMYEDNRRHGLPPSDDERIAQAVHLIDTGWTVKAAAECVGVSTGKIDRARAVTVADRRARQLHVDGWQSLPASSKWRLSSIHADPIFAEASKLAVAAGLDSSRIYDLASKLNDTRSEAAAHKIIAAETEVLRTEIQAKSGGNTIRQRSTPRVRMLNAISALSGCDPVDVAAACANKDQAASLGRMILDSKQRLDTTLGELQKRWR